MEQQSVTHDIEQQRFEEQVGDHPPAFLSYVREGESVIFDHTFVPGELRGRGIAARLVRTGLEEARRKGWRVIPQCSYVATFVNRHPEYADLLEQE